MNNNKMVLKDDKRESDRYEIIPELTDIYKPIKAFGNFLIKHGGHTGGWQLEDHSSFVELRKKHNFNSTIRLLRQKYPDIEEDDIKNHNAWYNHYIKLKCEQERAIKFWRTDRNEREISVEIKIDTPNKSDDGYKRQEEQNAMVKSKIQSWKESKLAEKQEEEIRRNMLEREIEEMDRKKRLQQKYRSNLIREYKQDIISVQRAMQLVEEIERQKISKLKAASANRMIAHFREKDEISLKKKQLQKLNISLEAAAKNERTSAVRNKLKIKADSDRNRLLQPTKEWENKIKLYGDTSEVKPIPASVDQVKHLAIPIWRKDIK